MFGLDPQSILDRVKISGDPARVPTLRDSVWRGTIGFTLVSLAGFAPWVLRAVLAKAPTQVRLWFNEEIESAYASLVVLDTGKNPVTEVKPLLAPDDQKSIVLPLPELAPGKYSVKFRVLSLDGHVIQSSFDFTVKGKLQEK